MSSACGPLSGEQLASEVIRIRAMVLEVTQHRFLGVPFGDLEDAYSRLIEQALAREFPNSGELSAWMLEAMRNDANDVVRSARVRKSVELDEDVEQTLSGPGGSADPEDAAIAAELKGLFYEFLVALPEDDRLIAYLHIDCAREWTPRQIARQLGISLRDVERTTARVGRRLKRFVALYADPDALCDRRRHDVLAFLQTGQASLALRIHLQRCPSCGVELRRAQEQLRAAILPLLPVGAVPAAGLGLLARAHHAAATHPATERVNDAIARVRKLVPGGAVGGGSAALTAKVLAAGAVLSVGAALHVVSGTRQQTPHRDHRLARVAAVTTTPATTTPPPAVVVTQPTSTPTIQPIPAPAIITTTTMTTPARTSTTPAVVPVPDATAAAASSSSTVTAATASATPTLNPYPIASAAPNASATSQHTSSGSSGSSSSPLPTTANLAP